MLNLLVSRPYLGQVILRLVGDHSDHIRLLVDSGAFTNWRHGIDTDVRDYIPFIKELPVTPRRYFALDKIGDPGATADHPGAPYWQRKNRDHLQITSDRLSDHK